MAEIEFGAGTGRTGVRRAAAGLLGIGCALLLGIPGPGAHAQGEAGLSGREIAERVNARPQGEVRYAELQIEMIDREQKKRVRETRTIRRDVPGRRETVIVFDRPRDIEGTGLLTHDHAEQGHDDDQWLYLPAARKLRQISTADRGGAFMGTDFSFDDMRNDSRVTLEDYEWKAAGSEPIDGAPCWIVDATPVSPQVARELGYSRLRYWVDGSLWLARKIQAWDADGALLKTVQVSDIREVEGIWTAHRTEAQNHQSGHRTVFALSGVKYGIAVSDEMFGERALVRGLRIAP